MEDIVKDYKQEIAATRVGCLGSSDGKLLAQVDSLGKVPKSAYKRLAVVNGLIPQVEIPKNAAMIAGDAIEMKIYEYLRQSNEHYESNPLWESKKYSTKNCKLISHPDLVYKDDENKVLNVYEVKTTKYNVQQTRLNYNTQLYIHDIIAKEKAIEYGKNWRVRVFLVHYDTNGLDLEKGIEFDTNRLTVHRVRFVTPLFNMMRAMAIVDSFLEDFTSYYDGDEVDADLLPENVRTHLTHVTNVLMEIEKREEEINEFKKRLYDFMLSHDVKVIKNDFFNIVRVDASESKSFDAKRYVEDLKKEHPKKSRKIIEKYTKNTKRKGYCTIKLKTKGDTE